jgi:rubredoxin
MSTQQRPRRYRCTICEHIYDPAEGDPLSNIPPGTPFEQLPEDWICPDCGAVKADFEPMED